MSNLRFLDVRLNHNVDNLLLETALSLSYRQIYIVCHDTSVDTNKFVFDHENTTREFLDRECLLFKCKNLSFETFNTKLTYQNKYTGWKEGDIYYIGSPIGSDFDSDLDDIEDMYYEPYEQEYQNEDDLDEFLEEETEMYKEI